jgi:hypothetical protein
MLFHFCHGTEEDKAQQALVPLRSFLHALKTAVVNSYSPEYHQYVKMAVVP